MMLVELTEEEAKHLIEICLNVGRCGVCDIINNKLKPKEFDKELQIEATAV